MKQVPRALHLGTDVVSTLLHHGRPLLLVDTITAYAAESAPRLCASRYISANEPIFDGHFARMHLWPGIYTIEGLGQSCNLLFLIHEAQRRWAARGGDPEEVLDALLNLDAGSRMRPGYDAALAQRFIDESAALRSHIGVSSAVDIKFVQPVFAGCRLDYDVTLVRELDRHIRFDVLAEVDGKAVARGSMTAFTGVEFPLDGGGT